MSVEEANDLIAGITVNVTQRSIPQTSGCPPFTQSLDGQRTVKALETKRIWHGASSEDTVLHSNCFQESQGKSMMDKRIGKKESWRNFVSTLNASTPSKVIRDKLKKVKGNYASFSVALLQVNGTVCQNLEEQANSLGEDFQYISSSSHYSRNFLKIKLSTEKQDTPSEGDNNCSCNSPFTIIEQQRALSPLKLHL